MLRPIRMCLWPNVDNRDNTLWLLVSLGCASGTNFTSGIIPLLAATIYDTLISILLLMSDSNADIFDQVCFMLRIIDISISLKICLYLVSKNKCL